MNLEESIEALDSYLGHTVDVQIWGKGPNAYPIAGLKGVLEHVFLRDPPADIASAVGGDKTKAIIYRVAPGETNIFRLWPERFVTATLRDHPETIELETQDGLIRVSKYRHWD